jgi:uridylate kinase
MVDKVYALGGSVIKQYLSNLDKIADALPEDDQFAVICGAGHLKDHQDAVRDHVTNARIDLVGIAATRFNAKTLQTLLDDANPQIPETVEEVEQVASTGQNIVMGGLNPGFSTDAVSAVVAELFNAELYIITDVDGIYSKDPSENPDAEKKDEIKPEKLLEMVSGHNVPGNYDIVDETAVGIIQRSNIRTKLIKGTPENLENLEGCEGTDIVIR